MTATALSRSRLPFRDWCALTAAALSAVRVPASAQERPAALRALEAQGITVVGTFPAPGGLTAWAAYSGQQPLALYATPDGEHVIAGTMLDAQGRDVTGTALGEAVRGPMAAVLWEQLESSHWIADGKPDAPRRVYMFTDPNCAHCNKFWADARPWVNSGKVMLHHIMVGILTPTSAGKAAALLASKDPAQALAGYERGPVARKAKALKAARPTLRGDEGVKPLANISAPVQAKLDANERLMASLRLHATPAFAWRGAAGAVQTRTGAPAAALAQILGPR